LPIRPAFSPTAGEAPRTRLVNAWHTRVMADEVVSHAFSHGFHPEHSQRLAAY
jgi:hemoglobin